jgi:hypothetical protein
MHTYELFYLVFHQNKNNDKNIICFDRELPIKVTRVFYGFTGGHNYFSYCFVFGGVAKKKLLFY